VGDGVEVVDELEQLAVGGAVLEALPERPDHQALYTCSQTHCEFHSTSQGRSGEL
jgi:hypothetical protein